MNSSNEGTGHVYSGGEERGRGPQGHISAGWQLHGVAGRWGTGSGSSLLRAPALKRQWPLSLNPGWKVIFFISVALYFTQKWNPTSPIGLGLRVQMLRPAAKPIYLCVTSQVSTLLRFSLSQKPTICWTPKMHLSSSISVFLGMKEILSKMKWCCSVLSCPIQINETRDCLSQSQGLTYIEHPTFKRFC